jgi:glycosyltransferase involved in cell wall biosynthesis
MLKKSKLIALILTQNNQATISKCIESIYNFVDVIVVVDGFSSDNTLNFLKKKKNKNYQKKI